MDSAKLNDWLQVVGMFAVVASLIFVGMQMRQDHDIALSGIYQARAQMTVDINLASTDPAKFVSATAKIYADEIDQITPEELVTLEYNLAASIVLLENNHYQYETGFLSESHWGRSRRDLYCLFSLPLNRTLLIGWEFRPEFQKVLDEEMDRAEKNPSDCWRPKDSTQT
jgi:hypothetical protein